MGRQGARRIGLRGALPRGFHYSFAATCAHSVMGRVTPPFLTLIPGQPHLD